VEKANQTNLHSCTKPTKCCHRKYNVLKEWQLGISIESSKETGLNVEQTTDIKIVLDLLRLRKYGIIEV
jgi:hypothetical protein